MYLDVSLICLKRVNGKTWIFGGMNLPYINQSPEIVIALRDIDIA
jgi:hypothetical protein